MIPTILLETVTKKNPKMTMSNPVRSVPGNVPVSCGRIAITTTRIREPRITTVIGISRSVLESYTPAFISFILLKLSRNAETIVGSVFSNVIKPPAATAPAPI